MLLYFKVFTPNPIVGIDHTTSPKFISNLSLFKIVVFPAASNPNIRILIYFLPKKCLKIFEIIEIAEPISNLANKKFVFYLFYFVI